MSRHGLSRIASILILLGLVDLPVCRAAAAEVFPPPNIIVFLVDDMGVMDTSVPFLTDEDGKPVRHPLNEFFRTPQMERLAARGVRFNNFCAMSVCSPSRISLLTGQNAARHGTTNWINPDQNNAGPLGPPSWNWQGLHARDITLPRLLQRAGYRTIHVGKGHFAPRAFEAANPQTIGFDINVAGGSIGAPGSYYGTKNFGGLPEVGKGKKAKNVGAAVLGLEKYHGQDIFLTEALTLEAKAHLSDAVKSDKPFFLYFAQYAVHSPHQSDPRYAEHYAKSGQSQQAQNFATLVEGMDKSLGDMLDHLDTLGIADNTLVFFLGDNGSDAPLGNEHAVACAAPLRGKKGSHYEGGMRVPFIAAWAKPDSGNANQKRMPIASGMIQSQQAAVYDMFPTILDLVGQEAPATHPVDGKNLESLLTAQPDASRNESFLMHYPHSPHRTSYWSSYRDGEWKVIYHYFPTEVSGGSHYQLFHLKEDPFEQNDLAASKPEELKRLLKSLILELEQQKAVYPKDLTSGASVKPELPQ